MSINCDWLTGQMSDTFEKEEHGQSIDILKMYTVVYDEGVESGLKKNHVYCLGSI